MTRVERTATGLMTMLLAVAAFAAPAPLAGAGPDPGRTTWQLHWQHENAVYAKRQAAADARAQARLIALHWQHENALHRTRGSADQPQASTASPGGSTIPGAPWSFAAAVVAMVAVGARTIGIRRQRRLEGT